MDQVILVDENDLEIGAEEKMEAHTSGKLHRAFSIFIYNSKGEMMLQKRSSSKYHSGGLWTNACCSHPRPGETTGQASHRRLLEEMGFDCPLKEKFSFVYKAELDKGLTEHEYDYVIAGFYEGDPRINLEEAEDWKWISPEDLEKEIKKWPEFFTYWFKIAYEKLKQNSKNI
jgi:isopentenyl-diphosphate Delta-isomerase